MLGRCVKDLCERERETDRKTDSVSETHEHSRFKQSLLRPNSFCMLSLRLQFLFDPSLYILGLFITQTVVARNL